MVGPKRPSGSGPSASGGGLGASLTGLELLPLTTVASLVGMLVFITVVRWWKHASHRTVWGVSLPVPGRWTLLSGLCTAAIIGTTTLAYTFDGTSIVFMMLLMRGGVLVIAPVVDALSRRKVRWFSWIALGLSLGAVLVATIGRADLRITMVAAADVALYLAGYFVRLRCMTHLAKADDPNVQKRYFVEEQMVATPAIVLLLLATAFLGEGSVALQLRHGFTGVLLGEHAALLVVIGLLSQATGVFGGLILLDKRENSFCVPVNRASSILAGVVAGFLLSAFLGAGPPEPRELAGAALVIGAIVALSLPQLVGRMKAAPKAAPKVAAKAAAEVELQAR